MYIESLSISNYNCLRNFDIQFDAKQNPKLTVLIGRNGTGKSSVFEVLVLIFAAFRSDSIASEVFFDYRLEYVISEGQRVVIAHRDLRYEITLNKKKIASGGIATVKSQLKRLELQAGRRTLIFPNKVIYFYSGMNKRLDREFQLLNGHFKQNCHKAWAAYRNQSRIDFSNYQGFPLRQFVWCDEETFPIYLLALLQGDDPSVREALAKRFGIKGINRCAIYVTVRTYLEKIGLRTDTDERAVFSAFKDLLLYLDESLAQTFREDDAQYVSRGGIFWEFHKADMSGMTASAIYVFLERLKQFVDLSIDIDVNIGGTSVNIKTLSEGQRQFIKIMGLLNVSKNENCLLMMDEPDAHLNPLWKYELTDFIKDTLEESVGTQALIATHDPMVINGLSPEEIRIFEQNDSESEGAESDTASVKAITPQKSTVGLGIDGILQSASYYGLPSVLDKGTRWVIDRRRDLFVKRKETGLTPSEDQELSQLNARMDQMYYFDENHLDDYYLDYVIARRKREAAEEKTSQYGLEKITEREVQERNQMIDDILKGLLRNEIH